jgi:predicted amino acid racemase
MKSLQKDTLIETLGVEFNKQYGVTIYAMIKQLKREGTFVESLQICSIFQLKKSGKSDKITLTDILSS